MGSFGGYFKGEKKKKKKGSDNKNFSAAPVFVAPEIVKKGKEQAR